MRPGRPLRAVGLGTLLLACAAPAAHADQATFSQPADKTPPAITLAIGKGQKLGAVLRKGLKVTGGCSEPCVLNFTLTAPAKRGKVVHAAAVLVVGRATLRLSAAGKRTIAVKLSAKTRKALRKAKKVTLTLRVVATDGAGNSSKATRTIVLRS